MTSVMDTGNSIDDDDALTDPWPRCCMTKYFRSVVKVTYKDIEGTGAFYEEFDTRNRKRLLFITSNHVVPTNSFHEIFELMKIVFPINGKENSFLAFKKDHFLCCWTWKCYCIDATVIELSASGEKYLRDINVIFFQVSDPKVKNLDFILEISDDQSTFVRGNILKIKESKLLYHIAKAAGSIRVGAPLMDQDCRAVAIYHRDHIEDPTNNGKLATEQLNRSRMALLLREIIKASFNQSDTL